MKRWLGWLVVGVLALRLGAESVRASTPGCGNDAAPPCGEPPNSPPGGGGLPDAPPGPPPDPVCPDADSEGTSSIKPYRANKRRQVTDLQTQGAEPILFTRIYNSRTTDFTTNALDFGWKQTWQHNWNYEVREMTTSTFGEKDIRVRYPNGDDFKFALLESNGTVRAAAPFLGDRLVTWTGDVRGCTLVRPDGWECDFRRVAAPRYELAEVRDGLGSVWSVFHDDAGRVSRIENNFGRWLEISRTNMAGTVCIDRVEDSDGRAVGYGYTPWSYEQVAELPGGGAVTTLVSDVALTSVVYPDGTQAAYTYAGAESLTQGRPLLATADDPMHPGPGARVQYAYNYDFRLDFGSGPYLVTGVVLEERSLDTGELVVSFPEGSGDEPLVVRGDGTEVGYFYTNGLLVAKTDGEGRTTRYLRDQNGEGYVTGIVDALGNTVAFRRDGVGRILSVSNAVGAVSSFTYDSSGRLATQTDPRGGLTAYQRDAAGRLVRLDHPDGSWEAWTYNAAGQYLTHRRPNGGTVSNEYYAADEPGGFPGDLKSVADPLGNVTRFVWSNAPADGRILAVTDPAGAVTVLAWDWRGNLLSVEHPDGAVRTFRYDAYGNCTNVVDELGHATAIAYDAFNRPVALADPFGRTTTLEYGLVPGCGGCGHFASTLSRVVDPGGRTVEWAYDRSGFRTNETVAPGTPFAASTAWTADAAGRLATQTDANGNRHVWVRDAAGRVIAETNAIGGTTTCEYDLSGNLVRRVDSAGTETFAEYDAMDRPVAVGSGTLRLEYAYAPGGACTSAVKRVNGTVVESAAFAYDLGGRLLSKTDSAGHTLAWEYDARGQRSRFTVPGVFDLAYAYDARGNLVSITNACRDAPAFAFGYDAAGRPVAEQRPNGTTVAYDWDEAGQLLSIAHRSPGADAPFAAFAYAYDASGNRIAQTTPEGTSAFAYDPRGWLASAAYPDGSSETFSYDPGGNRTSLVAVVAGGTATNTTIYHYGTGNRLLSDTSESTTNTYAYDAAGCLTNHVVNGLARTFAYDFLGRMTSLVDTNGAVFTYTFDAEGNRSSQALNDCLETRFVHDGPNVVLELDATNQLLASYVNAPGIDRPLERTFYLGGVPRQIRTFHADALGSIAALSDATGLPVQTYAYAAFGSLRSQSGPDPNRITYTGREQLGDSQGWMYYRHRVYTPSLGRFSSVDPLGFVDAPNLFIYVHLSPFNWIDSWGLESSPWSLLTDGMNSGKMAGDYKGPVCHKILGPPQDHQWEKADLKFAPNSQCDEPAAPNIPAEKALFASMTGGLGTSGGFWKKAGLLICKGMFSKAFFSLFQWQSSPPSSQKTQAGQTCACGEEQGGNICQ